ncbi:MAG: glycosyltransferase [Phycisphaerae bacterium]|nr:glycosyltransferase [Phycisphaerae bacterium]
MQISVLIPSLASPDRLARCFDALGAQTLPADQFEVLYSTPQKADTHRSDRFRHVPSPTNGLAARRNALLAAAKGDVILFLADDVVPLPDCLEGHLNAHQSLAGKPALVMGAAPAVIRLPDRLLDRVARETSLVAPLDQMEKHSASIERDWTFRNALFLNMSFRAQDAAGMLFDESPEHSEYADLEWAWRVTSARSLPLVYRHQIRVRHDHRIEPDAFLDREFCRGTQAFRIGLRYPRFAKALFGREIGQADEIRYSRAFVEAERGLAEQLRQELFALADVASDSATPQAVESIYNEQSLLKRWTWRLGLISAATQAANSSQTPAPMSLAA